MHEGTNNAIRHSAARIGPSTKIEKSLVILNQNSIRTIEEKSLKIFRTFKGGNCMQNLNVVTILFLLGIVCWRSPG